jgi:hypothetical protein
MKLVEVCLQYRIFRRKCLTYGEERHEHMSISSYGTCSMLLSLAVYAHDAYMRLKRLLCINNYFVYLLSCSLLWLWSRRSKAQCSAFKFDVKYS